MSDLTGMVGPVFGGGEGDLPVDSRAFKKARKRVLKAIIGDKARDPNKNNVEQ